MSSPGVTRRTDIYFILYLVTLFNFYFYSTSRRFWLLPLFALPSCGVTKSGSVSFPISMTVLVHLNRVLMFCSLATRCLMLRFANLQTRDHVFFFFRNLLLRNWNWWRFSNCWVSDWGFRLVSFLNKLSRDLSLDSASLSLLLFLLLYDIILTFLYFLYFWLLCLLLTILGL